MNQIIIPNWPIAQKKYELMMLQELLKDQKITRILEIGTWTGGTALLWAQMVSIYDGVVYCCDLNFEWGIHYSPERGTEIMREYPTQVYRTTQYNKYIKEIKGNTHNPEYIEYVKQVVMASGPVDFMFIDGDHSYEGVKADFYNFIPLLKSGGICAFHDILDTEHHRRYGCRVDLFWSELKTSNFEWWEFIDNNEYSHCCGSQPDDHVKCPSKSMGIGAVRAK